MRKIQITLLVVILAIIGASAQGENLFDWGAVHEIRIESYETGFWDTLTTNYENAFFEEQKVPYEPAKVTIDGTVMDSVGVRQKGYSSHFSVAGKKKPLKLDFNEYVSGQKYDGLKKINLANGTSDPSLMRDFLSLNVLRTAGLPAARVAYAKVYINDEYWGLYVMIEQVDSKFLKRHFDNKSGNLFKCMNNTNLEWQGNDKEEYKDEFELKTNEEEDDWSFFLRFVDNINNTSSAAMYDSLTTLMNVENLATNFAIDIVLRNWDSYLDHGRNFYMYHNPETNKLEWIPWDYNFSFTSSVLEVFNEVFSEENGTFVKPLLKALRDNEQLREIYLNSYCNVLYENVTNERLDPIIDQLYDLIRDDLDEDPNKLYTIQEFDASIVDSLTDSFGDVTPGLKTFITESREQMIAKIEELGVNCTVDTDDLINGSDFVLSPNPTSGIFTVRGIKGGDKIQVLDMVGRQVTAQIAPDNTTLEWNMDNEPQGIYFVNIIRQQQQYTMKLIVQ